MYKEIISCDYHYKREYYIGHIIVAGTDIKYNGEIYDDNLNITEYNNSLLFTYTNTVNSNSNVGNSYNKWSLRLRVLKN